MLIAPDAINAPYSPRLSPAVRSYVMPFSSSTAKSAASTVSIHICVYSVILIFSFSSKHIAATSSPVISDALSKTFFAHSKLS